MKGATDYEERGSLKNPVNQVVAVLPHDIDPRVVVRSLHEAGFSEDSIGVLAGRHDAHKLDAAAGKHGWLAKLAQIGPEFGDLDAHHLRNYVKATRAILRKCSPHPDSPPEIPPEVPVRPIPPLPTPRPAEPSPQPPRPPEPIPPNAPEPVHPPDPKGAALRMRRSP